MPPPSTAQRLLLLPEAASRLPDFAVIVDTMITLACEHGGVIPLANPTLSVLLAAVDTGVQAVAERQRNGN